MSVGLGPQLALGSRSTVHAWGRDAVAKVPLRSTPDGWIELEAAYTVAVHAVGAPVPRLVGIEEVDGRATSIYQRVNGPSMWSRMVEQPSSIPDLARTLAAVQAQVFAVVPPVSVPDQRDRLACKVRVAANRVDASLLDALAQVSTNDVGGSRRRLCHGDLHPGNVILGRHGPVLIDWFDVSRGDPMADVARTMLLVSPETHGPSGPAHLPGATPALLAATTHAYLAAVAELRSLDQLDRWMAVEAVARVAEGVEPAGLLAIWDRWHDADPLIGAP